MIRLPKYKLCCVGTSLYIFIYIKLKAWLTCHMNADAEKARLCSYIELVQTL